MGAPINRPGAGNLRGQISSRSQVIGADPFGRSAPELVVAVSRAGALGLLDVDGSDSSWAIGEVRARIAHPFAIRTAGDRLAEPDFSLPEQVDAIVLAAGASVSRVPRSLVDGRTVLATVRNRAESLCALRAGADGLIAKGAESGGLVGDTEAFVLLQQLLTAHPGVPIWVQGGIGLYTAAAAVAAGAHGVLLDSQLVLARETRLDRAVRQAIRSMDGSETRVVGDHRVYTRPDLPAARISADVSSSVIAGELGTDIQRQLLPLGQDAAAASVLADRFVTAGGIVTAVRRQIHDQIASARATRPLAAGHGVARTMGTRYPIAQGPMTRVSDRAAFAAAVADAGALPFLALALLRRDEVRVLLEETSALLGDRPWGVGILGFVPPELREEQLEVVRDIRPPVALIAGGRPSQAAPLEAEGILTYLHAPSPGLVETFVKAGARRFVFEGRACGGHVGPRSSFVLWESAVERLSALRSVDELDLLFAGGIHDARSAAAVAALGAPLVERGARVGVLMGTAYLFTQEVVATGAITPVFQREALACDQTVLLETAPGHATRCAATPFVTAFSATRARLEEAGTPSQQVWEELESLNLGRLRIASKGLMRDGANKVLLEEPQVREEGMFMLGDVATLRQEVTTLASLHESVTDGAVAHLSDDERAAAGIQPGVHNRPGRLDVAIVGMATMLPGARNGEEYWANILAGVDSITEVPSTRWDIDRYYDPTAVAAGAGRKTPSKWGGFLAPVGFDALAYGIPPRSLPSIDPVQLLALEVAAAALRDAGYERREFDRSRASVIFGAESGTDLSAAYGLRALLPGFLPAGNGHGPLPDELDEFLPELTEDSFPGVLTNVIAGRIANRLDLGGINYTVDAACAASLAAIDLSCKELVSGSSDLVLCGGADLHNGIADYLLFSSVHALAPRGRCRAFDASADGIVLGEGVVCVVLKRLADAERDGDRIYAVIDAVAGSSDGRALGLTAPRAEGQRRALERAYHQADRSPVQVGLVEAHGTGTVVGDATELETITDLFSEYGPGSGTCVLGSVKSQIGHTKCTAGLAGVVKTARALYHGVLPPTLHIEQPNPGFDQAKSPFRFLREPQPWIDEARRAGVSAFGFGGTNFHAVLSSYEAEPDPPNGSVVWPAELVVVRAPDADAASRRVQELAAVVQRIVAADPTGERHRLRDVAGAICSQGEGPVQVALVATDLPHLARLLDLASDSSARGADGVFTASPEFAAGGPPPVAFLFPGQGSQRVGMLRDLFIAFPQLRRHLRRDPDTAARIFPPAAFDPEDRRRQNADITDTRAAQPALGLVERALADLLTQLGIHPAATAGHSYGELVALAAAGVFDDDGLTAISHARGDAVADEALTAADPGAMAAVNRSTAEVQSVLVGHPDVVVANQNSPRQSVISGPTPAVEAAMGDLAAAGMACKRLNVACAFHSSVVAGARERLGAAMTDLEVSVPRIPVWSNSLAEPYPDDPDTLAGVLADQVMLPVRFAEQIESMYDAGHRVFLEVGPGRVLTTLVGEVLGARPHRAIACDVKGEHGIHRLLLALAELVVLRVDVDVAPLFAGRTAPTALAELPVAAPGWTVDGHLVRDASGQPVAGGLRPASDSPTIGLGPTQVAASGSATEVVSEYLRNLRETVAAERDVMLRFLGAPAVAAAAPTQAVVEMAAVVDAASTAVPAPEPTAGSARQPGAGTETTSLLDLLLAIVSDRTGYPPDMLGPDLDLEADLSIDSIKRIEILGELAEKVGLPTQDGSLEESAVEALAQMKTLRAMVDWLEANNDGADNEAAEATGLSEPEGPAEAERGSEPAAVPAAVLRGVVEEVPVSLSAVASPLSAGGRCLIVDDGSGVARALADQLRSVEVEVEIASAGHPATGSLARPAEVAVIVDLMDRGAPSVFDELARVALAGTQCLLCVSASGATGGQPGLLRALRTELPDRTIRSVVVPADADPAAVASWVREELGLGGPVDVRRDGADRFTRSVTVGSRLGAGTRVVDPGAVVLLTGGARGITARVACSLAEAGAGHIHLVGRTEPPNGPEESKTARAADLRTLRQVVAADIEAPTPAAVEAICRKILAEREVRATMDAVRAAGAEVHYHTLDVRDACALSALVTSCAAEHGRLDGIVHGAGIIEDRRFADKTADSYRRVFDTKASAAQALLTAAPADVGFVVLFASVSGVFGNRGQVDYAAANDALDAMATAPPRHLAGRVLSVDWGPWGGSGMVSEELAREYARRGIGLIDPHDGVAALFEELAHRHETGRFAHPQVIFARADLAALSTSFHGDVVS